MLPSLYRLYSQDELAADGYPREWHTLKHEVRAAAGHRCVRCRHPYRGGEHGNGEWSPCDVECSHTRGGVVRVMRAGEMVGWYEDYNGGLDIARAGWEEDADAVIEAQWRILTVHHLGGPDRKFDCRWHQLVALCQRCHLTVQGKVDMERAYLFEHSDWFKVYAAGHYAAKYEGREISREEAEARVDELLAYERLA